jgi:hypothetical protein
VLGDALGHACGGGLVEFERASAPALVRVLVDVTVVAVEIAPAVDLEDVLSEGLHETLVRRFRGGAQRNDDECQAAALETATSMV